MKRADIARLIPRTFFGWTFGNSWQRGLIHIWCTTCGRDLDWAQQAFVDRHPNPMCGSCTGLRELDHQRDAREAERRWAETHVIRSEVPWVTTLNPGFIPPVLHEAGE